MKKPMIGVTPLFDSQRDSVWMLPGYLNAVLEAGGVPMILPFCMEEESLSLCAEALDGFLFTGGQDVDPGLYGEEIREGCQEICRTRDKLELRLLDKVMEKDKPVLGICRGLQFLNVFFNGSLHQDLKMEMERSVPLKHSQQHDGRQPVHQVEIKKESLLYDIVGRESLMVNSFHHQGIKRLSPALTAAAVAPDGLIEAAEFQKARFCIAVQWHPEMNYTVDEDSCKLFARFVSACC